MTRQFHELFESHFWRVFDVWLNCARSSTRALSNWDRKIFNCESKQLLTSDNLTNFFPIYVSQKSKLSRWNWKRNESNKTQRKYDVKRNMIIPPMMYLDWRLEKCRNHHRNIFLILNRWKVWGLKIYEDRTHFLICQKRKVPSRSARRRPCSALQWWRKNIDIKFDMIDMYEYDWTDF